MSVAQIFGLASRARSGMQTGYRIEDLNEACSRVNACLGYNAGAPSMPQARAGLRLSQVPCR